MARARSTLSRPPLATLATGLVIGLALCSAGCPSVTLYQPQKNIHRPVIVPRHAKNFENLRIVVRCNAHQEFLPPADANRLCTRIGADFERQGAKVETVIPAGRKFEEDEVFDGKLPDLTLEINSRIEHHYDYPMTNMAAWLTLSLIPRTEEYTYSQRVMIFAKDGSVLVEDVFRERFVEYTGLGVWGINWVMDTLVRSKEQKVLGDVAKEDFSRDFYGQLRQLTFNAKMRSEILGLNAHSKNTATPENLKKRRQKKKTKKKRKKRKKRKKKPKASSATPIQNSSAELK